MTAAVFKATYSDWKLVKTRGVVQVIFEVPLAEADLAYKVVGGMPDASEEKWFGIARLDPDKIVKPRAKTAPEKRLAQQAGIACSDPVFWKFIQERDRDWDVNNEEGAASYVRLWCGIQSRSEIIPGTDAADKWDKLYSRFIVWRDMPDAIPSPSLAQLGQDNSGEGR